MTPISGGTTAMNPYAACSSCATSGAPWLRGRSVTDGGTACVMEHWKERKTIAQRLLVCLNTVDSLTGSGVSQYHWWNTIDLEVTWYLC